MIRRDISLIHERPTDQVKQTTLHIIICGDKDSDKSALVDHLLKSSKSRQICDGRTNTQQAEDPDTYIEQNFIGNIGYRSFSTARRKFFVSDIAENDQTIRNMAAAALVADAVVILADVHCGIQTQTQRYAWLASLTGIRHIILAINMIDLVDFNTLAFQAIEQDFLKLCSNLEFTNTTVIPITTFQGNNVFTRSADISWYNGPTLIDYLETLETAKITDDRFVFYVQEINHLSDDFQSYTGTVVNGQVVTGDTVRVIASGQTAQVKRICSSGESLSEAYTGDAITLVLNQEVKISCDDIIATADSPLEMTDQFTATLFWTHADLGLAGRSYKLKLANQQVDASITTIKYCIDVNTGIHESCRQLEQNDITVCNLALNHPVAFDTYATLPILGSFTLMDQFSQATVAVGLILHNLRRAQNVHRQALSISRQDRERLNKHKGKVIWFTGLSGSGKSTIANALEKELHSQGRRTYILDGDNIRQGLNKDLGFTDADRVENIRRVAEVAKLMMDAGLIVITAFISPFRAEREMARQLIGEENFVEVYINTPLEVCEQRDPKGLYKKARNGQLPNMTGIDSPYEAPATPAILINSDITSTEETVIKINCYLSEEGNEM